MIRPPIKNFTLAKPTYTSLPSLFGSIANLATKRGLLASHRQRKCVEAGGLISCKVNDPDNYRLAAVYVDKILKGANPGFILLLVSS
jgi:ABC-type uncharacterized transport system substrate-binding protein